MSRTVVYGVCIETTAGRGERRPHLLDTIGRAVNYAVDLTAQLAPGERAVIRDARGDTIASYGPDGKSWFTGEQR